MRAISVDANPKGPGRRFEDLSHLFDETYDGRRQAIQIGSYARIDPAPERDRGTARTWTALIWTGLPERDQAILSDEGGDGRAVLSTGKDGAEIAWAGARLATGTALKPRRWYRLWASVSPDGRLRVGQMPLDGKDGAVAESMAQGPLPRAARS